MIPRRLCAAGGPYKKRRGLHAVPVAWRQHDGRSLPLEGIEPRRRLSHGINQPPPATTRRLARAVLAHADGQLHDDATVLPSRSTSALLPAWPTPWWQRRGPGVSTVVDGALRAPSPAVPMGEEVAHGAGTDVG